jgi:hypothetical protein
MNNWFKMGTVAMVVAVVSLMVVSASAFAQVPAAGGPGGGGRGGMGGGMGMGGPQNSLVAAAAQVLGLNQVDLVATLNTGKTIAEVANDKGVAPAKIVDAFVAARKTVLDQAVTSGRMTQAQADAQLTFVKTDAAAQITAKFQPRGYGDGTGTCTGLGTGLMQNRGGRWNTAP